MLTAEDLLRNFELGDETSFLRFRENKYGIFDRGHLGNDNLLDNLVQNPERQTTGSIFLFKVRLIVIPHNSNRCIFDSPGRDNVGQSIENGSSVLLKLSTTEHVLSFINTTYLINNHLLHVYENQFVFFPELERSAKTRDLRRLIQI